MVTRSPRRLPCLPLQQVSCSVPGLPPGGIPSFPSLFSVTLSLSLSSEVPYLWPAASQPTPETLQDEMTLNCSEASSEEALLPSIPRTGEPHPQGGETALPNPRPRAPAQRWDPSSLLSSTCISCAVRVRPWSSLQELISDSGLSALPGDCFDP